MALGRLQHVRQKRSRSDGCCVSTAEQTRPIAVQCSRVLLRMRTIDRCQAACNESKARIGYGRKKQRHYDDQVFEKTWHHEHCSGNAYNAFDWRCRETRSSGSHESGLARDASRTRRGSAARGSKAQTAHSSTPRYRYRYECALLRDCTSPAEPGRPAVIHGPVWFKLRAFCI